MSVPFVVSLGILTWRQRGLAGLLTLAVYQTSVLAIVQIGAFGVWGIATGIALLRQSRSASNLAEEVR